MKLNQINRLTFVRKDKLEEFDDIILKAAFPEEFIQHHHLKKPVLYVSFYHQGGHQVEVYDEKDERGRFYHLISEETEKEITAFARKYL